MQLFETVEKVLEVDHRRRGADADRFPAGAVRSGKGKGHPHLSGYLRNHLQARQFRLQREAGSAHDPNGPGDAGHQAHRSRGAQGSDRS